MSNRRILIFSLAYYPIEGGAEIAVKEITQRISADEIEWDMVTMRFDDAHPPKEKVGNVTVYRIDTNKLTFPIAAALFGRKLHKEKAYDAIWSIMAARAGAAALFFKYAFPDIKYILSLQEGDPIEYMKRRSFYWINPFFRKIFIKADIVQAISHYLADYAAIMGFKGKVEVIPNGVNFVQFASVQHRVLNKNNVTLITTSRLVEKNGVRDIIEALEFLPENVKLIIIGIGPLENNLKFKIKNLKLESRIKFLGHVPYENIPKYLHEADIFIRPSLSEGFGNSFIEAMAAGLPVIATSVGGIPDFLINEETGLFCEVNNPESIARQVTRLLNDPVLMTKLKENGPKLAREQYDWDLIVSEMKSRVFQSL